MLLSSLDGKVEGFLTNKYETIVLERFSQINMKHASFLFPAKKKDD
jgi:hypothetical protein